MKVETGSPSVNGLYAIRQWYTWRILEWHEGAWWHVGRSAKWPVGNPPAAETGIEAFLGPLPVISQDFTKPPLGMVRKNADAMEFDL